MLDNNLKTNFKWVCKVIETFLAAIKTWKLCRLKCDSTFIPTTLPLVLLPMVNLQHVFFFCSKENSTLFFAQKGPFNHRKTKFWLHIKRLIFNCDLGKRSWQGVTTTPFSNYSSRRRYCLCLKFIHNPWPYFLDSLKWALMWSLDASYSLALTQCMPQEGCHYDLAHLEPSQTWLNKMGFNSNYGLCINWTLKKY